MPNRYYIINESDPNKEEICALTYCAKTRVNNLGTKFILKLASNDRKAHSLLKSYTEYDLAGIKIELAKEEWVFEIGD